MPEFGGLWKRYTPSVHYRLGSPTLSQLAFHREGNPNFQREKSHWDKTLVKKKKKVKKKATPPASFFVSGFLLLPLCSDYVQ